MHAYTITTGVTVTIEEGKPFLPSDMQKSRHPSAWLRKRWHYIVYFHGQRIIDGNDLETPADVSPEGAVSSLCSFIFAEGERYVHADMGQSEPVEGWIFDGKEQSEFCYVHSDDFTIYGDELAQST